MRHRKKKKALSPNRKQDQANLMNQAVSLILHEKIITTKTRAKNLRTHVEKLITVAKKKDLNARRTLIARISKQGAVRKLMEELGPRYKERPGGYTRVHTMEPRMGDRAPQAQIELV
jgi:large subunit ribosomal protein L17